MSGQQLSRKANLPPFLLTDSCFSNILFHEPVIEDWSILKHHSLKARLSFLFRQLFLLDCILFPYAAYIKGPHT